MLLVIGTTFYFSLANISKISTRKSKLALK